MIKMLRPAQQAAGDNGWLHRDLFAWLGRLVRAVNLGVVPVGAIVWANLSAADIAAYFTSGLGNAATDYEGWAICDGTNGTPDLSDRFIRTSTTGGGSTGGSDDSSHTHDYTTGTPSATAAVTAGAVSVASATHTHTGTTGAASATDNRPAYFELVALMRTEVV